MKSKVVRALSVACLLLASAGPAAAQWQTQSLLIKPGWTAVYLFVDPSYTNLDSLVGNDPANPIQEVWLWEPVVIPAQFINNPLNPITGSSQWANWERTPNGPPNTLASLAANSAYLIHSTAGTNYVWNVKGQPVAPAYSWSASSINLFGFPTVPNNPPALDNFLALAPDFQSAATFYQYVGGNLSSLNPALVIAEHTVSASRGTAFWVTETNLVSGYFGPFQVAVNGNTAFGTLSSSVSIRLINRTAAPLTVSLSLQPSETPPSGQAPIVGVPPLIVRGALNPSNVTYSVSNLTSSPMSWTLAPQGQDGWDIPVVLGVNRLALTNSGLYAGILKFTDSYGYTEIDLPTSAQMGSYTGLWVGNASLSQVSAYLKSYQTNADGTTAQYQSGTNLGAYIVAGINTNLGPTAAAFPMRLILHNDGTNVNLLQRVFYGSDIYSNTIIATGEGALDASQLGKARRISAVQFPWTPNNQTWLFSGQLVPGGALSTSISVAYDDQASNPFLHTYHPDHDNLDPTFQTQLPIGLESYQIDRRITLNLTPPGNDFASLTQYGRTFSGAYTEAVTLTGIAHTTRTFNTAGTFTINRLSPNPVLTHSQ